MILDLQNVITLVLASCAVVAVGWMLVDHLYLYDTLKKLGVPMEYMYLGVPFYLLSKYYTYKNNNKIESHKISESFIRRFKRNMRFALLSIVLNIGWLWLFLINKAMNL